MCIRDRQKDKWAVLWYVAPPSDIFCGLHNCQTLLCFVADCYHVETTRLIDVHTVYYCDSTLCVCVDAVSVLSLAKVGNKHIIAHCCTHY